MDDKIRGEESEIQFCLEAMRRGFRVSKPIGDSCRYDAIVDTGSTLNRVQVKSCSDPDQHRERYTISLTNSGRKNRRTYTPDDTDFIAVHIRSLDVWYILPIEAVTGIHTITVRPRADNISQYNQYEEAWHLLTSAPATQSGSASA